MKNLRYLGLFVLVLVTGACNEIKPDPPRITQPPVEPPGPATLQPVLKEPDIPATIGLVTGSATGTYIKFGYDIARIAEQAGVEILVKESEGSLDNIRRINSSENAALGIVQSDVLGYLSRHENKALRQFIAPLRLVFPLYNEEVHLFARKDIDSISALQGKRVITGSPRSGNFLTAQNLMGLLDVTPGELQNLAPEDALTAVLRGEADAMFYVAGKPVDLFQRLDRLRQDPKLASLLQEVHFVPLDDAVLLTEYGKAALRPKDYPWLQKEVATVAVKALLVGYNFSSRKDAYYQARCEQLGQLGQAMRASLPKLKRSGHPKWGQVDLAVRAGQWKRDSCVLGEQL